MNNNHKALPKLESARTALVLAALDIKRFCSKDVHIHAEQLEGAAEMIQDWIKNIREGA
jgi:hypothetical protein